MVTLKKNIMEYNVICFMLCIKTEDFHEDIVRHVAEKFDGIKRTLSMGENKTTQEFIKICSR